MYTPHCVVLYVLVLGILILLLTNLQFFSFSNEHTFYSNFSLLRGLCYSLYLQHIIHGAQKYYTLLECPWKTFFWFICIGRCRLWNIYLHFAVMVGTLDAEVRAYGVVTRVHIVIGGQWKGFVATNNYKL